MRQNLADYPDRHLVANLMDGVRLEADVELHTVLVPHLTSLSMGFESVENELRRLHSLAEGGRRWYEFFSGFPFWPMYLNGQGSTAKKDTDVWRRTTEGGGPRQEVFDETGLRALSINEASHMPHVPSHFADDQRPEFQAWLRERGLPRDLALEPLGSRPNEQPTSKWPKEVKPTVQMVLRDLAIYRHAADFLDSPIYIFGDDAKDYFVQFAIAEVDLPKLGIVFLAKPGELGDVQPNGDRLLFVSERRLGFGTHGASNTAQRFSEALLWMFRREMDGRPVLVASALWPQYACKEFGGAGWAATVLRCSKHTAIVRFTIATTRDGRPYEDARVPLNQLRPLPPRQLAA